MESSNWPKKTDGKTRISVEELIEDAYNLLQADEVIRKFNEQKKSRTESSNEGQILE